MQRQDEEREAHRELAYRAGLELRRMLGFEDAEEERPYMQQGTARKIRQTTRTIHFIDGRQHAVTEQTTDTEEITLTEIAQDGTTTTHTYYR